MVNFHHELPGVVSFLHQYLRTLDQLNIGESAVVHHVGGDRRLVRRLMEMGLLPGTSVETIRRAPLGDPLKIRLRGYLLSLRLTDASKIALTSDATAATVDRGAGMPTSYKFPVHAPRPALQTTRIPRVLVAGNANSGKTTVFNALTGARAQVSNYPGVTVTRSSQRVILSNRSLVEIVDLPGTYSLSAHSPDEQVAVDEVLGRHAELPDAVIVVIDAGAFERGLYLVLQIAETGVPVIVALNMLDEAIAAGADFDATRLGSWLGATVVPMVASRRKGLDDLRTAISDTIRLAPCPDCAWKGLPLKPRSTFRRSVRRCQTPP